ncbi:serine/arginine repetitive matrix protein 2-like [Armigeres subalbatus]|uniref:serine/arginine repetitive matrix protein 2-like n=1 Tax=Armigeres subalbatus TaxID=124917 RepID=UPI002ECFCFBC
MATPMGYGTLLECPYNKSHRVQATAMARHLFKCRKMHPNIEFVTCPFNHAHKVAEPELKMHTANCEDRANFDMYKYCITTAAATHNSSEAQEPELIYNQEDPIAPQKVRDDDDECWDDLRIPAYNPQEYCAQAKIIRKATLKTPAEKRAFYEQETKRHKELDVKIKQEKGEDVDEPSNRLRSRSRSPVRSRRRSRSPLPFRGRSPESRPSRSRRSRSSSRGSRAVKRRSPSPSVSRSHRSRSNSRKSRSLSPNRDRKRRRSPSVERQRVRRSPSPLPDYRRAIARPSEYDRYEERERYARAAAYERYDYPPRPSRYDRYESYVRYPHYDYSSRFPARIERDVRRAVSRDRDDDEYIYRRDFRE